MPGQQPNCLPQRSEIRGFGWPIHVSIALENLEVTSASSRQLLSNLGGRLADISGESRESSYLFQRCSVLVQRFNAVLLHDSLPDRDSTDC